MFTKQQVREIRKNKNLTQEAFAKRVGVSTVLVAMTEGGIKPISRHYLQKIANAFKETIVVRFTPI